MRLAPGGSRGLGVWDGCGSGDAGSRCGRSLEIRVQQVGGSGDSGSGSLCSVGSLVVGDRGRVGNLQSGGSRGNGVFGGSEVLINIISNIFMF